MSGDFKNMSSLFQTDVLRFFLKCKNYSMRVSIYENTLKIFTSHKINKLARLKIWAF